MNRYFYIFIYSFFSTILFWGNLSSTASENSENAALHREIRLIRRAYLDVLQILPTSEEIDWYVVYNQNGYLLAIEFLLRSPNANGWKADDLLAPNYIDQPEREIPIHILEKNIVYLAGLGKEALTPEKLEAGIKKFIHDALLSGDNDIGNSIDYMINQLTCRPASVEEINTLSKLYNTLILKNDDLSAWKTIVANVLKLHDCAYK